MSACKSEKANTKSGWSESILSIFADVKAETLSLSLRTTGGRTAYPVAPTIRFCSPSKYNVSTVSAVRQIILSGGKLRTFHNTLKSVKDRDHSESSKKSEGWYPILLPELFKPL